MLRMCSSSGKRLHVRSRASQARVQIEVCTNKDCRRRGAQKTLKILEEQAANKEGVEVVAGGCFGECGLGVNVCVNEGKIINGVTAADASVEEIIADAGC
eukprot:CAMPEP_0170142626 /NCGR_PEP_ID=MMETSP0033_2-20121228/7742_1 /TAXON_ID=195969 /ORGANISM="Dolichomastix tenuilepis, Strain CCMP3274" /LENGTH=99 /DNA_ID=CAMNT_0010378971 /DNA_START=69 /DNA_END=368 /DNA_ORIENTATION=-